MFSFIPSSLHYYVAKIGKIFVHIYSYYRGRRFFVAYPAGFSSFCDSFFFLPEKKGGGGEPVSGEYILSNSYRGGCYSEEYCVFSFWKLDSFNPYYDNDKKKTTTILMKRRI